MVKSENFHKLYNAFGKLIDDDVIVNCYKDGLVDFGVIIGDFKDNLFRIRYVLAQVIEDKEDDPSW